MQELFAAIQGGDRERVRSLLAERPDALLAMNPDGATPVLYAKYLGQAEVLEEIVAAMPALSAFEAAAVGLLPALERAIGEAPESLRAWSADGWTALHLACFFGHLGCAQWLVQQGSDVQAQSRNAPQNRPLHAAAAARRADLCEFLLSQGADPDARQRGGYTALHSAAQHGDEALVKALLDAGASPRVADDSGKDAAQYAEDGGHPALAARLRRQPGGRSRQAPS
jgi:ankyrin repeat protein